MVYVVKGLLFTWLWCRPWACLSSQPSSYSLALSTEVTWSLLHYMHVEQPQQPQLELHKHVQLRQRNADMAGSRTLALSLPLPYFSFLFIYLSIHIFDSFNSIIHHLLACPCHITWCLWGPYDLASGHKLDQIVNWVIHCLCDLTLALFGARMVMPFHKKENRNPPTGAISVTFGSSWYSGAGTVNSSSLTSTCPPGF